MMVRPPRDNARRMWNRKQWRPQEATGIRNTIRAAAPPTMRLRCKGPQAHVFRAASKMRCPNCQHDTIELPAR